jgi:hypothetical protein
VSCARGCEESWLAFLGRYETEKIVVIDLEKRGDDYTFGKESLGRKVWEGKSEASAASAAFSEPCLVFTTTAKKR